jgi:GTP cyclohydrolase II
MRLLTNNRKHLVGLRGYGLEVTSLEAIPREPPLREVAKPKKNKAKSA